MPLAMFFSTQCFLYCRRKISDRDGECRLDLFVGARYYLHTGLLADTPHSLPADQRDGKELRFSETAETLAPATTVRHRYGRPARPGCAI